MGGSPANPGSKLPRRGLPPAGSSSRLKRVMVANRGEIALRIIRAARKLGIETVLAASVVDADSMAAREAERTVIIGAAPARRSYLNADLIVHAAKVCGCDALHPGYGFLSERAELAKLCAREDIVFVGPTANSIEQVGEKTSARRLAKSLGLPVVEGSERIESSGEALRVAGEIGYPVLTKAAAGGGGRGMVIARDADGLRASFDRASAEALEAFNDGGLFLERYVERARHVEVQVVGDGLGRVIHFGERDCSVQRRYQKMIEESPAAALPPTVRDTLQRAAVRLMSAVSYRNAGTVEFIYDLDRERFSFMEVNSRIQVEHPVSEAVCDVDLIQLQLRIAAGDSLMLQQDITPCGHAIEARVIAENPNQGFTPCPGRIERWRPPDGPGIRLDSAMHEGATVSPFYDSMIAKLIVSAETRAAAVTALQAALSQFQIEGVTTNLPLLRFIVRHPDFIANRTSTRWLEDTVLPAFLQRLEG
jgi:acetyl-CoA carboxylase, biotin carboxylase subunit